MRDRLTVADREFFGSMAAIVAVAMAIALAGALTAHPSHDPDPGCTCAPADHESASHEALRRSQAHAEEADRQALERSWDLRCLIESLERRRGPASPQQQIPAGYRWRGDWGPAPECRGRY